MEIPADLKNEMKALVEEIARPFDEKIKSIDRLVDEKWNDKAKDVLDKEAVKRLLDERVQTLDAKGVAVQKAQADRMDELEAKMKAGGGNTGDPDAEIKAALDGFAINRETGKGRLTLPTKSVVTITNANAGGATFYAPGPGIREYPQDPLTLRSVLMPGTIDGSHFKFERELAGSMEGDADYQGGGSPAEGATKPTMDIYTEIVTREVATIAVTARVSQQVFDDRPAFISFVRGRMGYRVERKLDREALSGTGNGSNGKLEGINTVATAYDNGHLTGMDADSQATLQKVDILRFVRNQIELANYTPNFFVLNPTDWAGIETLKVSDTDGRYVIGDPRTGGSTGIGRVGAVWGVPVLTNVGQSAGDFTGGDGMEAQLFMRQQLEVLASTEDQDNFVKNLVTLRAELRALMAIYSALAFVTGDFASALAAT